MSACVYWCGFWPFVVLYCELNIFGGYFRSVDITLFLMWAVLIFQPYQCDWVYSLMSWVLLWVLSLVLWWCPVCAGCLSSSCWWCCWCWYNITTCLCFAQFVFACCCLGGVAFVWVSILYWYFFCFGTCTPAPIFTYVMITHTRYRPMVDSKSLAIC